jgi:DNA-binding transcriptional LysR family regulator
MRHVGRAFEELRRGLEMVSTRGPQFLRLHSAPSFATQWLSPRLARFLRDHPGIEVRLAAGTDCTRFLNDEFDADILYGLLRQEGFVVISLGEETITPLCTSDFARVIRTPMDLFSHVLIESETKQVRWSDWFARNGLPAPGHKGSASTGASSPSPRPPTASGWLWNRRDSPSARLRAGGWYVPWPGLPTMSATSGTTWSSRGARASVTACDCS